MRTTLSRLAHLLTSRPRPKDLGSPTAAIAATRSAAPAK
jgi:hypothetical protein